MGWHSATTRARCPALLRGHSSSHFAVLFRIPVMVGLDPTNSGQWGTAKNLAISTRLKSPGLVGSSPTMTMKR
jgi:hypothetical protein